MKRVIADRLCELAFLPDGLTNLINEIVFCVKVSILRDEEVDNYIAIIVQKSNPKLKTFFEILMSLSVFLIQSLNNSSKSAINLVDKGLYATMNSSYCFKIS